MVIAAFFLLLGPQAKPNPQWIWAPGQPIPSKVFFRRDFDLGSKPQSGKLKITCDDGYRLYVNGTEVASHHSWYTLQTVDLKPLLHAGRNVLAVAGVNDQSAAGLLVIGRVKAKSKVVNLNSGRDWKFSLTPGPLWKSAHFNDSGWQAPSLVAPLGGAPWGFPADEEALLKQMLSIPPIKPAKKAAPIADSPDLARNYVWPASQRSIKGGFQQMRVKPVSSRQFARRTFSKPAVFIVDFGRELAGWVEVSVASKKRPDLTIQVGESNNRFGVYPLSVSQSKGLFTYRILPQEGFTGFRYCRVSLANVTAPVKIKSVTAVWRLRPANYLGSFSCSDPELNRIWEVGAYTVRLNLDTKALGAILLPDRGDRYPWMGDDRVAHRTLFDVFGDYDLAMSDLDFFVKPGQKPIAVNDIPGYTLDWVIGLYDYWMYSGDTKEVKKRLRDVATIISQYDSTDTPKGWMFTDWEPELQATTDKSITAFHAKYIQAAWDAASMATAMGDMHAAKVFTAAGLRRMRFVQKRKDWPASLPQHVLTNAILAGLVQGFPSSVGATTTTPYFTYYVLEALSAVGQDKRAIAALRSYWGGMLQLGGTTTWEYFLPEWAKTLKPHTQPPDENGAILSLCHPWSSGATAWLSDHVLGITPATPGFRRCIMHPFLGDLSWAKGSLPTPHGLIWESWKVTETGPSFSFSSPKGVTVELMVPKGFRYKTDGRILSDQVGANGKLTYTFLGGTPHRVWAYAASNGRQ